MKRVFKNRLKAIDWIAGYVDCEGQFEVLREQLNFNYIRTGDFFVKINPNDDAADVILLGRKRRA